MEMKYVSLHEWMLSVLLSTASFVVPFSARAGFATSGSLGGVGSHLKDGTVYVVSQDKTITRSSIYSATYVDDNATAVIYIQKGVTLTIQGGDASGTESAGAAIRLNSGSTLIVTGEGNLNVKGGNAAKGGKGKNASAARCDDDYTHGGKGGDGGAGGGGAAAAIGGVGGSGGSAGLQSKDPPEHETSVYVWSNFKDTTGADGGNGGKGGDGTASGNVYLLGSVKVNASGGEKEAGGGAGLSSGSAWYSEVWEFHAGSGGGGGGGAGGGGVAYNIAGGGGAGGGGGGAGGNGGHFWTNRGGNPDVPDAAGGRRGLGSDDNDGSGWTNSPDHYDSTYGGKGGDGGAAGSAGSNGTCYRDSGVTVSGSASFASASTHPAIEYKLVFSDEWRHCSTNDVKLGYALPPASPSLSPRASHTFLGWFDRKGGMGTKYYDADGVPQRTDYDHVGDLTLYAAWQLDSSANASVTVSVNGGAPTGIISGTDVSGTGWSYDGDGDGTLAIGGAGNTYDISGIDESGEIHVVVNCDCTVNLSSLMLDMSAHSGVSAISVAANKTVTLSVSDASRLIAGDGTPAIKLANGAALTITGDSSLVVAGGGDGPDIGLASSGDVATVMIDTENLDMHLGTGRLADGSGRAPAFRSLQTGKVVWAVKVPGGFAHGAAVSWSGLPAEYTPLHTIADETDTIYIWLPDDTYHFTSLASSAATEWVARVNGAHRTALRFAATGLLVNERDAAYLAGPGWYFDENHSVCLTNAGPFTVSGDTSSANLRATCSCDIIASDVKIFAPDVYDSALVMDGSSAVNLMLSGTNVFSAGGEMAGITVNAGQRLTISGDGALSASGGFGAGIGSWSSSACGTIEILGGTVTASSALGGAGIGSGRNGSGGSILIAGGTVTATGGYNAAGIGGGYNATGVSVRILGGDVTANGGADAAGIGCGRNYTYGTATGDTVEISGGIVRATANVTSSSAIGSSYGGDCASVTISGGTVMRTDGWVMIISASGDGSVKLTGGSIRASSNYVRPSPVNDTAAVRRVAVTGLVANARQEITWFNRSDNPYGLDDIYSDEEGKIYLWLPAGTYYFKAGGMTYRAIVQGLDTMASPWTAGVKVDGVDISELRGNGWMYDDFTLALVSSNHVVSGRNTATEVGIAVRSGGDYCISNLVLNAASGDGEFAAILIDTPDKVALQIEGSNELASIGGHAAIEVEYGKSLAIRGSGSLSATGGNLSAGIGSGENSDDTGAIKIEGGTVAAVGGAFAAGIGGAQNHTGGYILITGGNVVATGGDFGAGIGGGREASAGVIKIQDGCTVNANGGKYAAGIGCGHDFVGGIVQISGGEVTATGGLYAAGIGTGYDYTANGNVSSCEITISGGTVTATGASDAAGIGSGYNYARVSRSNTYITISGGKVTATGSGDGAGIGGGRRQECGSIAIGGGIVGAYSLRGAAIGSGAYADTWIGSIGIYGGTVMARASAYSVQDIGAGTGATGDGSIQIGGGSINARFHMDAPHERDSAGGRVWPITIAGLPANARIVSLEPEEGSLGTVGAGWVASYGTDDVYADEEGKIYVWLRNGVYDIVVTTSDDADPPSETALEYTAYVVDAETEAKPYEPIGILVNWRDIGHFVGKGWNQDNLYCVHLDTSREYVLSGKSIVEGQKGRVGFDIEADNTSIVLSNLVLNLYAESEQWGVPAPYGHVRSAITVKSGNTSTFTLCETNSVIAGLGAGIYVPESSTVRFLGDGFLEVTGGDYGNSSTYPGCESSGAAIGGVSYVRSGTIEIALSDGGEIVANGGYDAAGIGAGAHGNNGTVLIQGGTVTAKGSVAGGTTSSGGAGIGGGYSNSDESYGDGGTITILGGVVTAIGGGELYNGSYYNGAAGIGGGYRGSGGTITISNATVVAKGFSCAAGIGGGDGGTAGNVVIDGGDVTAIGGQYAMGIGSGRGDSIAGYCRISSGIVHAEGGELAAGIGGVALVEISGGIVYATGGRRAAGIGGNSHASGCPVTITGGTVFPTPGEQGSGTGGPRPASAIGPGDFAGYSDSPVLYRNQFDGGAIYAGQDFVKSAPTNRYNYAVYVVDFDIGIPTNMVTSLTMELLRVNSAQRTASFSDYGKKDLCTNEDGFLRLWLPSTGSGAFIATVVMEDGSVHYFCFSIGDDGTVRQEDFLVVNGDFLTGTDDQSGTGWNFKKDTGIITLNEDSSVQGIATNGAYRILVPNGGASMLEITNLDFTSKTQQHASAIVFSNDCNFVVSGHKMNTICAMGLYSAGLEVALGTALTISGDGSLTVSGGSNGAGIGSRCGFGSPGKIVINSGTIFAKGGEKAAGIGGGISSNLASDNIEINGGLVTAFGGRLAAGIGSGYMGAVSGGRRALASEAVKITGGTVVAERGSTDATISDMISSGNAVNVTGYEDALIISGGNVHGLSRQIVPVPRDEGKASLRYCLFTGLTPGARPLFGSGLPESYGTNDLVADYTGSVCVWLPSTNAVRGIVLDGEYFAGGGETNNVFSVGNGGEWPESMSDETSGGGQGGQEQEPLLWRVSIRGLPAVSGVREVSGLESCSVTDVVVTVAGNATIYLPASDTQYDFSVAGLDYHALVSDAPTVAWYETGVTVDGVDLGTNEETQGWSYDGTAGVLSLKTANRTYTLAGTNANWDVAVRAEAKGVKIVGDMLCLNEGQGHLATETDSFTFAKGCNISIANGTISAYASASRVTVLGGSVNAALSTAVDSSGAALHKVTVGGFQPGAAVSGVTTIVSDSGSSSLAGYDFTGVFPDESGSIYIWLPDAEYEFAIGDVNYIVVVAGADVVASSFRYTGVYVNGVDVGRPEGVCWRNEGGIVHLYNERTWYGQEEKPKVDYVITGTNTGAAVVFRVDIEEQVWVTLDNLVMENPSMTDSPFTIASGGTTPLFRCAGTNVITSVIDGCPAIRVSRGDTLSFGTNEVVGIVYATGAGGAPAIGPAVGDEPGSLVFWGGTVIASGGPGASYDLHAHDYNYYDMMITGASVCPARAGAVSPQPVAGYGSGLVYCVSIPGFEPGEHVGEETYGQWEFMNDPNRYPGNGWIADRNGAVHMWLTNGVYEIQHSGGTWRAVVDGTNTVAVYDGEPSTLSIESMSISGGVLSIIVSGEPRGSVASVLDRISILASDDPADLASANPANAISLSSADGIETTANPDGTATVTVPLSITGDKRFYRIIME